MTLTSLTAHIYIGMICNIAVNARKTCTFPHKWLHIKANAAYPPSIELTFKNEFRLVYADDFSKV